MPEKIILEKPLVIIGEEDVVIGFKALGFKVYALRDPQEFKLILDEIINQGGVVCLVQEDIYREVEDQINIYKNVALPIFIPFAKDAKMPLLERIVKDIRLKATGTN